MILESYSEALRQRGVKKAFPAVIGSHGDHDHEEGPVNLPEDVRMMG